MLLTASPDSFDIPLGNEPRLIIPNLWGQEAELSQTLETQWGSIQRYLSALLAWRGIDELVAEEIAIFPGMEELANLLYIVVTKMKDNTMSLL
jgi:arsenite-transporting ATPase